METSASSERIIDLLESLGYNLKRNCIIEGFSGIKHKFDMIAYSKKGDRKLALELCEKKKLVEKILRLKVKGYDTGITECLLILKNGSEENVEQLSKKYGAIILKINELEKLRSLLKNN